MAAEPPAPAEVIPVHRTILAVDMEQSTRAECTNPIKADLRCQIYHFLYDALECAGVTCEHRDPLEDRGDGALALIHPADTVPKTYLLSRFLPKLTQLLADHNKSLSPGEHTRRMLRLRVVIHAGEVHLDTNGYFGEAIDVACKLLNAPRLKKALQCAAGPLALIVSDEIYWAIVRHEYDRIRADTFTPDVRIHISGRRHQGWIHVPTVPFEPSIARLNGATRLPAPT